jgi:hypothetical protein
MKHLKKMDLVKRNQDLLRKISSPEWEENQKKNLYYEEIPMGMYDIMYNDSKLVKISEYEIGKIKTMFGRVEVDEERRGHRKYNPLTVKSSNGWVEFFVLKLDDEWWLVKMTKESRNIGGNYRESAFKCDQIEGLIQCLRQKI